MWECHTSSCASAAGVISGLLRYSRCEAFTLTLKEVALEETELSGAELDRILDPRGLTEGGIHE